MIVKVRGQSRVNLFLICLNDGETKFAPEPFMSGPVLAELMRRLPAAVYGCVMQLMLKDFSIK